MGQGEIEKENRVSLAAVEYHFGYAQRQDDGVVVVWALFDNNCRSLRLRSGQALRLR